MHQVIDGVLVVNPGTLSKKRGAGTYAALAIQPRTLTDEDREAGENGEMVANLIYERARSEIRRI